MAVGFGLKKPSKESFRFDDFMPGKARQKEKPQDNKPNTNMFFQQMVQLSAAMGARIETR
jgi:hypothetical protein